MLRYTYIVWLVTIFNASIYKGIFDTVLVAITFMNTDIAIITIVECQCVD